MWNYRILCTVAVLCFIDVSMEADSQESKYPIKSNIKIDRNDIDNGAKEIIRLLRDWAPEDIGTERLTKGITNVLVKCFLKSEPNGETFVVRVYGENTDKIIDRDAEIQNFILLSGNGLGPELYVVFENGLCFQFIRGDTLTTEDVRNKSIYPKVAKEVALIHKVKPPQNMSQTPILWTYMDKFYNLIPEKYTNESKQEKFQTLNKTREQLYKEVEFLKSELPGLNSSIVFCHNDLLLANIMWDGKKITIIDYEYAGMNYELFDIGNHFDEFTGVDTVDFDLYPDKDFQISWLRHYEKEYSRKCVPYSELEVTYDKVQKFALSADLFWGLWALAQAELSTIDFDYMGYAILRLEHYYLWKEKLFNC